MRTIATPVGDARVETARARGPKRLTLVLGHGAGGGIDAPDLVALAGALPGWGISVVRVEQPWHVAGRRVAAPPAVLDEAWLSVVRRLRVSGPLAVGGRSAGARVACRTAAELGAVACVALAFPLHPPGRPEQSRLAELVGARVPTLVVQGERDAFGSPRAFPADERYVVHPVPGADHSFRVAKPRSPEVTLRAIAERVATWLLAR